MKIYFVRHGQAMHNVNQDYTNPANQDARLTRSGRAQAYTTARELSYHVPRWDVVFTSPLTRCLETMDEILQEIPSKDPPVATDFLLECQGDGHICNQRRNREELTELWPQVEFNLHSQPRLHYMSPRESAEDLESRMHFVVKLVRQMEGEHALIVSHHDLIEAYLGESLPNAGYCVLDTSRS